VDPEDIAQEVFAVALKRLDSYQGNSSISTWLFGITRKIVANARRRASLRRMVGLHDPSTLPSRAALADEDLERYRLRHKVQTALHRLKKKHREVLVLVDLEGLPASEVATMLHVPVGTVYSRLHHARRAFAVVLKRMGLVHHRARAATTSSSGTVGSGITRKDKRR
jgi:RNA polymerase sigma-70 factor (ECF subfamily)